MNHPAPANQASPAELREAAPAVVSHMFSHFAASVARKSGHIIPFLAATTLVIAWAVSGPIAHWSDTWQLVMNTLSSAVTLLMVFVIQGSQNRDTDMLNAKLNEIIRSLPEARQEFLNLEDLSESQLQQLNAAFAQMERDNG
jgi:low affinity Fe/Cu permease